MKRKCLTVLISFILLLTLIPALPVQAAGDVVFSSNTTLSRFINRYNNVTIKSGVTVTFKTFTPDPQGLEISGALTVEPGGSITGAGVIIFEQSSTFSGIDLYYTVQGVEKKIPGNNFRRICQGVPSDYRPNFSQAASGHFVLQGDFNADPYFEEKLKEQEQTDPTPTPSGGSTITGDTVPVYRLFRPTTGEHLYTISTSERDSFTAQGWNDEGIAWYTPASSDRPVYRLYHRSADYHHYTTSTQERDQLVSQGWEDQGIGWYSGGSTPLYRLYDPKAKPAGSHHYTMSKEERSQLLSKGWNDEGIGWYGK
ncbi:MAG: hypothetical protein K6A92_04530 [Lachnospiraceae bacterium]|nr:hypothetical protein [Lachnospiraceae bacterium]